MTKTVSLSDEAYSALAGAKQPGESFSDVALRLARGQRKRAISEFAGAWKRLGATDREADELKAKLARWREDSARAPPRPG